MKLLNHSDFVNVSGGNLSSIIMDIFNPSRVPSEKNEWVSGSTIESPAYGKGEIYGKFIFDVITAAAATTIIAAGIFGGLFNFSNRSSK